MFSRIWKIGIHVLLVGIQVYFILLCFTLLHFPGTDIFFFLVLSFFFNQIEGLWQSFIEEIYQCHFPNSISF